MGAAQDLADGKLKFHQVDETDANEAAKVRRDALAIMSDSDFSALEPAFDLNLTKGRNIENAIGATKLPLGIAGPLPVAGEGDAYIPLATTEGALVASVNRGCSAIRRSGGTHAEVLKDGVSRGPVLRARDLAHAQEIVSYIHENYDEVRDVFNGDSKFMSLKNIETWILGRNVFLRFVASTGDAMGMNMVTTATSRTCEFIDNQTGAKTIAVSGNMCIDKKPGFINVLLGRGKTVCAEAVIKRDVVDRILKTTPEAIAEVAYRKVLLGSAMAGSLAYNAHAANIVAALFIATGQDPAQVVESSMAFTLAEVVDGDLYITVNMPCLEVATVGGGTHLPTQHASLEIMGCVDSAKDPGENVTRFSKLAASAVLAGELSLLGSLAEGTLSQSHERLGRGKDKGRS